MRKLLAAILAAGTIATASAAWAEDPPPPTPPAPDAPAVPPAPEAAPTPPPAPMPPPTPEERRVVVDRYAPPYAVASPRGACCAPCEPYPPACCQPRDECGWPIDCRGCRYGRFEVTLEGTYSFLDDPEGNLGLDPALVGSPLDGIDWDGIDYEGEFGGRVTLVYHLTPLDRVELRGAWWGGFEGDDSQDGVFGASPGASGLGDVSLPVLADLHEEADVYGGELNWWTELSCEGRYRFDVGAGVRYLRFDEKASADLDGPTIVTPQGEIKGPIVFPIADGFVEAEADNTFIGGQICAMLHLDLSQTFEVTLTGKGLFGNLNRDVDVSDLNVFAGGLHSSSVEDDDFVWGMDLEVGAKVRLTSRIALTAGYELLFLDDVQRAHDAMDFEHSNSGAVQARIAPDELVLHSFFFGVNFNF